MTQLELAYHAGMGMRTIQRIENDHGSPAVATLEAIAAALGCTASQLLTTEAA